MHKLRAHVEHLLELIQFVLHFILQVIQLIEVCIVLAASVIRLNVSVLYVFVRAILDCIAAVAFGRHCETLPQVVIEIEGIVAQNRVVAVVELRFADVAEGI